MFAAWGRFVYRFRWFVLVASILSIAAVVYSMQYGGRLGTGEFAAPEGTESGRVDDLLDEEVAKTPPSFMLIFGNEGEKATDPAFRDGVEHALQPLEDDERVTDVRTAYNNGAVDEAMISEDKHHSLVVVELKEGSFSERQDAYVDLRQKVRPGHFEVVAAGNMPLNEDFERVTASDLKRAETVSLPFVHPERTATGSGLWHRLATAVMVHPWRTLLPVIALLLVLGSPFLNFRLGLSGADTLSKDAESRRGEELLDPQFPDISAYPMVVMLDYPQESPLTKERIGEAYDLSRWLENRPSVKEVSGIVNLNPKLSRDQYQELLSDPREDLPSQVREALNRTTGDHITVLTAYTSVGYNTDSAYDLVREVREEHPDVGGEVLVGGWAAFDLDLTDSVYEAAPPTIAFVVLATYVVLFLLLGSVLLPIKAVVVNFLSISASYGALVWVFQEGHLSGLLNFTPGPINTTTPIIMFCILFGLSMDYEVMLLSRIKEEYERSRDNRASVALGIERTGRMITGAALIMATVFFSFGLAETVVIKAIGLGMGLAVMVDATIVRALLVPAAMRLMGHWNWWAPGPLARLHRHLGLSERSIDAPEPAVVPAHHAAPRSARR